MLILGSMPGTASLAAAEYYAHPQNSFWRIMGEILEFEANVAYSVRVGALKAARIALWDVLASCVRPGSADSAIQATSVTVNDIQLFLGTHSAIERVIFNGAKAEHCFRRYLSPCLPHRDLELIRVPSSSPAHAARSYAQKLTAWRAALSAET